jgi:hypothetical protein
VCPINRHAPVFSTRWRCSFIRTVGVHLTHTKHHHYHHHHRNTQLYRHIESDRGCVNTATAGNSGIHAKCYTMRDIIVTEVTVIHMFELFIVVLCKVLSELVHKFDDRIKQPAFYFHELFTVYLCVVFTQISILKELCPCYIHPFKYTGHEHPFSFWSQHGCFDVDACFPLIHFIEPHIVYAGFD